MTQTCCSEYLLWGLNAKIHVSWRKLCLSVTAFFWTAVLPEPCCTTWSTRTIKSNQTMGKTPQGSLPWLSKCWQPQSPLPQTRRFYFCGRTHRPNSMVNDFFQLLSSQLVKVLQVEVKLAPQFLQQDSLLLHHLAGGQLSRTPRLKAKETGSTRAFCRQSLLCSIILHALADSMHSCCMWLNDLPAFYSFFFNTFRSDVFTALFGC